MSSRSYVQPATGGQVLTENPDVCSLKVEQASEASVGAGVPRSRLAMLGSALHESPRQKAWTLDAVCDNVISLRQDSVEERFCA